jgi:hypothetical protein
MNYFYNKIVESINILMPISNKIITIPIENLDITDDLYDRVKGYIDIEDYITLYDYEYGEFIYEKIDLLVNWHIKFELTNPSNFHIEFNCLYIDNLDVTVTDYKVKPNHLDFVYDWRITKQIKDNVIAKTFSKDKFKFNVNTINIS